jgi:Domain of unknown function (DUF4037)
MKGLDLAEAYYGSVGLPMIRERFRAFEDRLAVGLAGPGSECFGFDDEVSRDHDWGPAFCLWLTDEDFADIGGELQKTYLELPLTFAGYGPRQASPGEEWRVGVCRTADFFRRFTGLDRPPRTLPEWLRIPEQNLATCTNGKVFSDPLGEFTRWRQALLDYYPEDIRLKKIASLCITIAQTGQYNFLRSLKRGEIFSASYSAVKFCADAIGLVFLLNRRYAPFYKWLHRAVRDLPLMGQELHAAVGALLNAGAPDQQADIMEAVSVILADELRRQGLSDSRSDFLLDHAPWVQANIIDERLRKHLSA